MLLRRMDTELLVKQESAVMARWQVLDLGVSSTIVRTRNLQILFYYFYIYIFKEHECLQTCKTEALRKMSCRILQAVSKRSSLYPLFWYLLFSSCLVGVNY